MITSRDRKIIFILLPLILAAGYWFMVLAPKRAESQKVAQELSQAQAARDTAEQLVAQLNAAKASFADDYAAVIRLGKAVPTTVDMPSLLVQLDRAARGTGIDINNFKPGVASESAAPAASTPAGGGSNPAAPGGAPAQSAPGKTAEKAGDAVNQANGASPAGADAQGGVPGAAPTAAPGLTSVPLTFTMAGSFFDLADFFHRMKRFVRVVNDQIVVRGRLMTVDGFSFQNTGPDSQLLKADVSATIYLTPASEGTTAGATEQGPAGAAPASGAPQPGAPSTPPPTAAATTP